MIVLNLDFTCTYDYRTGLGFELAPPDLVGNSFAVELSKYLIISARKKISNKSNNNEKKKVTTT